MVEESKKLINTFNKNYYKILKEQKTIFLNNEKYLNYKMQQEAEQEKPKKDIWNILEKIINIIIKILLLLFAGLVWLVACAVKGAK